MDARWEALTEPFKNLLTTTSIPLQLAKNTVSAIDDKIEELVHCHTEKPFMANSIMLAIRATPFIVASLHSPLAAQALGAAIACVISQDDTLPAETQTATIKATHALSLAFFVSFTRDVFQNPADALSVKTVIDASLTAAFLMLANKTEAPVN